MSDTDPRMVLTGNDVALAEEAAGLAIDWYKNSMNPRGKFARSRIAALKALIDKLDLIGQYAYPYESSEVMPLDVGDEQIIRVDRRVISRTRARALKANLRQ